MQDKNSHSIFNPKFLKSFLEISNKQSRVPNFTFFFLYKILHVETIKNTLQMRQNYWHAETSKTIKQSVVVRFLETRLQTHCMHFRFMHLGSAPLHVPLTTLYLYIVRSQPIAYISALRSYKHLLI